MKMLTIADADARFPTRLRRRLNSDAPGHLTAFGNPDF
jgi:hypothetical protein